MQSFAHGSVPLPAARDITQRVLSLLSGAASTTDIGTNEINRAMGINLAPDPEAGKGWSIFESPDLGFGWHFGVQHADPKPPLKPSLRFWFEHESGDADPTPVCSLPVDHLRSMLASHGWVERTVPTEIGSVLGLEFAKRELVLVLTPRDIARSGDVQCIISLQVSGGH
ncbi:hypothetical protein KPL74_04605 [Bacillus sp. NP157]|nr:hypothetical protein KPL74_04605 [Bacillus sp. NP157]